MRKREKGRGGRPWQKRERRHDHDLALIYGWHAVQAALENPARRIRRLLVTPNGARRIDELAIKLSVKPDIVRPEEIDRLLPPDAVHQGVLAEADPLPAPALEDLALDGIVLVLDQITDPHNFGAIVRSAAAFAVSAIVTTERHSPETTGVLAKSASGGLEYVPLVLVQNLARAMSELKARGFLLVGLDESGKTDLAATPLRAPLALVMGAEGKGLRQLTRETCDLLARLKLPGRIKSLNVSNAAAVALHIATTRIAAAQSKEQETVRGQRGPRT
jgi:23S rRNA (guanosine2251-2'-O)-methyltransferase